MPDPLFETRTPRFDLPLLFAGQSQKEGSVNEVTSRLDALLHLCIEDQLATPPTGPTDGLNWLVASNPTGDWSGHAGEIAARQAGNWLFAAPVAGMRLLNRATGQELRFTSQWLSPAMPGAPTGGTMIDAEARSTIGAIIAVLVTAGIVAAS
jgi:Protein of unknown function (DUF2793)